MYLYQYISIGQYYHLKGGIRKSSEMLCRLCEVLPQAIDGVRLNAIIT